LFKSSLLHSNILSTILILQLSLKNELDLSLIIHVILDFVGTDIHLQRIITNLVTNQFFERNYGRQHRVHVVHMEQPLIYSVYHCISVAVHKT